MDKDLLGRVGETESRCQSEKQASRSAASRGKRILNWFLPNGGTILVALILIFTQSAWARSSTSPENVPGPSATTMQYQGRLMSGSGSPLNGEYNLDFSIYDAPGGGIRLWGPESHAAVPVSDGLFSVGLGSQIGGGIPTTVWNGDRYLEITVGGETLSPRELIRSVPVAGMALTVPDGSLAREKLGFPVPELLGYDSCDNCGTVTESVPGGWSPVKGADTNDIVEVSVTTDGGPVFVQVNIRYETNPAVERWCGIYVFRDGIQIKRVHVDGYMTPVGDWGCSGGYLFTDLPEGTYTFQAQAWVKVDTTVTWRWERQIVAYQY